MAESGFWLQVDMITPMCAQLTYEGLLDEVQFIWRNNSNDQT